MSRGGRGNSRTQERDRAIAAFITASSEDLKILSKHSRSTRTSFFFGACPYLLSATGSKEGRSLRSTPSKHLTEPQVDA